MSRCVDGNRGMSAMGLGQLSGFGGGLNWSKAVSRDNNSLPATAAMQTPNESSLTNCIRKR